MISVKFDTLDENRRTQLATRFSPLRRKILFWFSVFISLLFVYIILAADFTFTETLIRSVIAIVLAFFVIYAGASMQYLSGLGGYSDSSRLMTGETEIFSYEIESSWIKETSETSENKFYFKDFVKYKDLDPEHLFIFKKGIIYLPKHAIKTGSIKEFKDKFNLHKM